MKLIDALETGIDCGLDTVSESILNIELHAQNLFSYSEMANEIKELYAEFCDFVKLGGGMEMTVVDAIELMKS